MNAIGLRQTNGWYIWGTSWAFNFNHQEQHASPICLLAVNVRKGRQRLIMYLHYLPWRPGHMQLTWMESSFCSGNTSTQLYICGQHLMVATKDPTGNLLDKSNNQSRFASKGNILQWFTTHKSLTRCVTSDQDFRLAYFQKSGPL